MLFAFSIQRGIGQFFQQQMRFTIEHAITLLDHGVANGLGDVTFTAEAGVLPGDPTRKRMLLIQQSVFMGFQGVLFNLKRWLGSRSILSHNIVVEPRRYFKKQLLAIEVFNADKISRPLNVRNVVVLPFAVRTGFFKRK